MARYIQCLWHHENKQIFGKFSLWMHVTFQVWKNSDIIWFISTVIFNYSVSMLILLARKLFEHNLFFSANCLFYSISHFVSCFNRHKINFFTNIKLKFTDRKNLRVWTFIHNEESMTQLINSKIFYKVLVYTQRPSQSHYLLSKMKSSVNCYFDFDSGLFVDNTVSLLSPSIL